MTKKVIWKAYFNGNSGYIEASKRYPIASMLCGFKTQIFPLDPLTPNHPLQGMIVDNFENCLTILHQIPTVSPHEEAYFTVTEFNICPPEWWMSLIKAKVILTQSKFCKEAFMRIPGIDPKKINIVYYPLPSECGEKGPNMRQELQVPDNVFLIGSVFEWVARKKPELMWQAFIEEFDKNEPVMLLNKVRVPNGFRRAKYMFNKNWKTKDNRLIWYDQEIADMGKFYRSLQCFCSPTAGEGWGAGLSEAMACGIPTVGSKHSGNLEFMNSDNSWLCDMDKWSYVGDDPTNFLPPFLLHDYMMWRLPKVSAIRKALREVYTLWQEKKVSPKVAEALKIQELCGIKNISGQINNALVDYL